MSKFKDLEIDSRLRSTQPGLKLGFVAASGVSIGPSTKDLRALIEREGQRAVGRIESIEAISALPEVASTRTLYKRLGKDPSRYRGSAEALLRRLVSGKNLSYVNNVVDLNNLISLKTYLPVGSYDANQVRGKVCFRVARNGEAYKGIGKETIALGGIPVFSDDIGPFGSPTSDSERTMIRFSTTDVVTVIISFGGNEESMGMLLEKASDGFRRYLGCEKAETWEM